MLPLSYAEWRECDQIKHDTTLRFLTLAPVSKTISYTDDLVSVFFISRSFYIKYCHSNEKNALILRNERSTSRCEAYASQRAYSARLIQELCYSTVLLWEPTHGGHVRPAGTPLPISGDGNVWDVGMNRCFHTPKKGSCERPGCRVCESRADRREEEPAVLEMQLVLIVSVNFGECEPEEARCEYNRRGHQKKKKQKRDTRQPEDSREKRIMRSCCTSIDRTLQTSAHVISLILMGPKKLSGGEHANVTVSKLRQQAELV